MRGHEGRFSRDPLPVFSAGDHCEQCWHGQGCPLFDVVLPAFPLPITVSSTLQRAQGTSFGYCFWLVQLKQSKLNLTVRLGNGLLTVLSFFSFFLLMQTKRAVALVRHTRRVRLTETLSSLHYKSRQLEVHAQTQICF